MVKGGRCGWSQHTTSAKHLTWWCWQKGGLNWRECRRWGLRETDSLWEEMYGQPEEEKRHGKKRKKARQPSPDVHRAAEPRPPPPPPPGAGGGGFGGGDKTAVLTSLWETTLRTVVQLVPSWAEGRGQRPVHFKFFALRGKRAPRRAKLTLLQER